MASIETLVDLHAIFFNLASLFVLSVQKMLKDLYLF